MNRPDERPPPAPLELPVRHVNRLAPEMNLLSELRQSIRDHPSTAEHAFSPGDAVSESLRMDSTHQHPPEKIRIGMTPLYHRTSNLPHLHGVPTSALYRDGKAANLSQKHSVLHKPEKKLIVSPVRFVFTLHMVEVQHPSRNLYARCLRISSQIGTFDAEQE